LVAAHSFITLLPNRLLAGLRVLRGLFVVANLQFSFSYRPAWFFSPNIISA